MQIQINTDHTIEGHESFAAWATTQVETALEHYGADITRVEIHLSDESGGKSTPNNKRCIMELRMKKLRPLSVMEHASTVNDAVTGASGKLFRLIEKTKGQLLDQQAKRAQTAKANKEAELAASAKTKKGK